MRPKGAALKQEFKHLADGQGSGQSWTDKTQDEDKQYAHVMYKANCVIMSSMRYLSLM
jgi:hypothetical protein